jgi:polyisoprenoid-binding protein YceI
MIKSVLAVSAGLIAAGALAGWGAAAANAGATAGVSVAERAAAAVQADEYRIDPVHTAVLFRIRHAGVAPFYGRFDKFKGGLSFDSQAGISGLEFTIDIGSINTNNADRDEHLGQADFFNSRQFPEATFTQTGGTDNADGTWTLTGDLTMYGTTKPVTVTVSEVRTGSFRGKDVLGFEAVFEIKRTDFGMSTYVADDGSDNGGLGNTVRVIVGVEAVKQ